jgi:hypothetical protein
MRRMDIAGWLRSLGLDRYEQVFRDNRIEADILPSLTVEDLKDLGVTLAGGRRRLLDAIALLGAEVPAPAREALPDPSAPVDAYRATGVSRGCPKILPFWPGHARSQGKLKRP